MNNDWVQALGWTLIHSWWEGAAIGLVVYGLSRHSLAERRYLAYCLGLTALLLAFFATLAVELKGRTPAPAQTLAQGMGAQKDGPTGLYQVFVEGVAVQKAAFGWSNLVRAAGSIWCCGVMLMSVRAGRAAMNVRALRREARSWDDEAWQDKLRTWLTELGISKPVQLCLTTLNDVPAVIGHLAPMVLLPAALVTRLSPGQIEALILHELMHIRRHDYLVNVLQLACETLLFFHPAAWWFSRGIREEREHCCDAAVARKNRDPISYVKALLALEEWRVNDQAALAVGAADGSLKKRVKVLLARPQRSAAWSGGWAVSLGCAALLTMLVVWNWPRVTAQTQPSKTAFEVRMVVEEEGEELPFGDWKGSGAKLRVAKEAVLDDSHVRAAKAVNDPVSGQAQVMVQLNNEGAARFAAATRKNIGRQLAVVIEHKVSSAPRVADAITGGSLVISGNFTAQEAEELARKLSAKRKAVGDKTGSIKLESYFLRMSDDPATHLKLGTRIDSASEDLSAWSVTRAEARELIGNFKLTGGAQLVAGPAITTVPGRPAWVEVGDVTDGEGFSVNAKRFFAIREAPENLKPTVIGQSIELLPELTRDKLIVAGKFLDRQRVAVKAGPSVIRTVYSAPFYVTLPQTGAFALSQRSKGPESEKPGFLLVVVIPEIDARE